MDCIKNKNPRQRPNEFVNEDIPNTDILVIDDRGDKLGIMHRDQGLRLTYDKGLDLVVVSPGSKPMVAKMMDYSKFRYDQQRKLKEIKKNQKVVEVKEIRLSPTIDKHDFDTKLKHALRFLQKGDKVKLSIRFFGRMITHSQVGREVMDRFIEEIGNNGIVEARPRMDGRNMIAVIAPANKE